jgi:acetyltransferase-like isoleucine patch superfamily enzyme
MINLLKSLVLLVIVYAPGIAGQRLRYSYYKRKLRACGNNVRFGVGVIIDGAEMISIGDDVEIDEYCIIKTGRTTHGAIVEKNNPAFMKERGEIIIGNHCHLVRYSVIMGYGGVQIGNYCTLSSGVQMYSLTNTPYRLDKRSEITSIMPLGSNHSPHLLAPVVLEENVWLGLHAIVMPGVTVGKNSFAVSNALLMSSFPENSYIAGQPAQRIKERFEQNV